MIIKKPEALILLGDRYETFIAGVAGVVSKTKIVQDVLNEINLKSLSIKIFSNLAELENQVIKSTFGDIYLSALIAIFKS